MSKSEYFKMLEIYVLFMNLYKRNSHFVDFIFSTPETPKKQAFVPR